jgi:hypothetical protein
VNLNEPEVEDLHPSAAGDEDVLGPEVAMNDAAGVCGGQTAGDMLGDLEGLSARRRRGLRGGIIRTRRDCSEAVRLDSRLPPSSARER